MPERNVLVIEDEDNLLEMLRYNLSKEGYGVYVAEDGDLGLSLARQMQPDMVILDIMLPKLDGFEVCRILRRESDVPILMLTARSGEIDRRVVGLELGADDYVVKPFSMQRADGQGAGDDEAFLQDIGRLYRPPLSPGLSGRGTWRWT